MWKSSDAWICTYWLATSVWESSRMCTYNLRKDESLSIKVYRNSTLKWKIQLSSSSKSSNAVSYKIYVYNSTYACSQIFNFFIRSLFHWKKMIKKFQINSFFWRSIVRLFKCNVANKIAKTIENSIFLPKKKLDVWFLSLLRSTRNPVIQYYL